jgi:SAM-dependent methyltransferase
VLSALRDLLPPPPRRILDVGCGEGRVGAALSGDGYDVLGVDASAEMVALASERHEALLGDACGLPVGDASFDVAVSVHVLMEVGDLDTAVAELARVVRSDGAVVAVVEHPFSSGGRVERYSEEAPYTWEMSVHGEDLGLGGLHRPLARYAAALERAGLGIDAVREPALPNVDPLSLALRASRRR